MSAPQFDPWKQGAQTSGSAYLDAPEFREPLSVMPAVEEAPAVTTIFVDGVQRREANAFLSNTQGEPVPASFQALAAGAAVTAPGAKAEYRAQALQRFLISSVPYPSFQLPAGHGILEYRAVQVADPSGETLQEMIAELRSSLERAVAEEMLEAYPDALLVVDGQLPRQLRSNTRVIGWIKSTRQFPGGLNWLPTLAGLTRGQYSSAYPPLFTDAGHEWFVALHDPAPGQHATAHLARFQLGPGSPAAVAAAQEWSSYWAPRYASAAYASDRAPQQPRPVEALEHELRRYLGSRQLLLRALLHAQRTGQLPHAQILPEALNSPAASRSLQP